MAKLTKRQFLKFAALASGAAAAAPLLAACGSAPAATPAPAKSTEAPAAGKPTEAPKPAATTAAQPTTAAKPTEAAKPTPAAAKPAAGKEPVTIRMHMRSGGEKSEPAIYVQRPGEWEQATGNKVKLEPIPSGQDYIPKVEALAASNTIGDVVFTQCFQFEHNHLVKYKVLEPIDPYLGLLNAKKSEWFSSIIDTITFDGKTYGFPKMGHTLASYIWINLKMFEEAGIKKPETYGNKLEDILAWAPKLSKGPKDRRDVYGYYSALGSLQNIAPGIASFGGTLSDKDGLVSMADSDEWMEWAKWNNQLVNVDKVHPLGDAVGNSGIEALFAAEKLAMMHNQRSSQRAVQIGVKDKFPWAVIQFPRGPKARGWPTSVNTHSVTAASKYKEIASSLTYAMADQRFAYLVAKEQGYLSGRVDNLEAIKELASDPFLQLQQKCNEQAEPSWKMQNLRGYEYETALLNHMDLLWLGKRQLDKAFMAELKKTLDEVMAKPA